ncbi:hypothetical protein SEA_MISCHIEF19_20 [Streptomyces phage Mischief19]|nr:hypothetical protein SEA_MISCHIEF19_20 [Streptomyces phage Mischief19]
MGTPLPPALPCDCCHVTDPRCGIVGVPFETVAETASQAGWVPVNLPSTINGNIGGEVNGYNSPSGGAASTTVRVTYTVASQNRVRGLRLWNQGGGILTDFDGLGQFTAEFYSGATLLATLVCNGGNGAPPFTFTLPGGQELNGVTSVVLRNLGKLSGSVVAPLWREIQLLAVQSVFPCRRPSGVIEWYDVNGVRVPSGDVVDCT